MSSFSRVSGEVRNGGDGEIRELGIKVYYLNRQGKPHLKDVMDNWAGRATFNAVYPVLANSAHPGDHARPLKPGESRKFVVDVPATFDGDEEVQSSRFGASVMVLKLGPK